MNILYVVADTSHEWNCSEWRCAVPARAINSCSEHNANLIDFRSFSKSHIVNHTSCNTADIIIIQRCITGYITDAAIHWKKKGTAIALDFDDAYNYMHPSNPNYDYWIKGLLSRRNSNSLTIHKINPTPLYQFKRSLRLVDSGIVPSTALATDWYSYNSIYVVPNYIDFTNYASARRNTNNSEITIGWGGSATHLQSFINSGVTQALDNICSDHSDVKLVICGGDSRIIDALNIHPSQVASKPWSHINNWPSILADFDIGIAPLHGAYDKRRSWIKVLEYMATSTPWIASHGYAYDNLSDYGILASNNSKDWESGINVIIADIPRFKDRAASMALQFAKSQDINKNVSNIIATYQEIIDNKKPYTKLPPT